MCDDIIMHFCLHPAQNVTPCSEYPVHSYTLVVVDSGGITTTQTSQATEDTVNIAISGLRENSHYSYYVLATNQFGDSNPSTPVNIGEYSSDYNDYNIIVVIFLQ